MDSNKKFHCDQCEFSAKSLSNLITHNNGVHLKLKPFKCQHANCSSEFTQKSSLNKHVKVIHGDVDKLQCEICDYATISRAHLEAHVAGVHNKEKNFKCDVCDKVYSRKHQLTNHIKDKHDFDFEGFRCTKNPSCEFMAQSQSALQFHIMKIHGSKNYNCEACGKQYDNRLSLYYHDRSVHKNIRYHCTECNSNFSQKSSLTKHIENYHGEASKEVQKCDECGKILSCIEKLRLHKRKVHSEWKAWHQCDKCEFKTKTPGSLKSHISVVHFNIKPFACDLCEFKAANQSDLRAHKRRKHSIQKQERNFKCDKCEFKSHTRQGVTTHINSVHLGLRPYVCDICGKSFTQSGHRGFHIKSVHMELKSV